MLGERHVTDRAISVKCSEDDSGASPEVRVEPCVQKGALDTSLDECGRGGTSGTTLQ